MSEITVGIIGLLALVIVFLTGLELGFAMAVLGFIGFSYIVSVKAACSMVAQDIFDTLSAYGFTVLPVFVLMGQIAFNGGIAKKLYDSAYKFIGHITGGLAMATVGAATAFGSVRDPPPPRPQPFLPLPFPRWIDIIIAEDCPQGLWPLQGHSVALFRRVSP